MSSELCLKVRERLLMDTSWKFHWGDLAAPPVKDHGGTYGAAKAGAARGAASPDYDDSKWPTVNLPHDWAVEGGFDPGQNVDHGFLARGIGWYRRKFRLDEQDNGKCIALEFDGVLTHCTVWLNGHLLHRNWCGYTGFRVDISDVASHGDQLNTLAVRVDANAFEGWWYEGAGIYRHVWLVKTWPVHVAQWGVWVNPVKVSETEWETRIETTVENAGFEEATFEVVSTVLAPGGSIVGTVRSEATLPGRRSVTLRQVLPVSAPDLWSLEARNLYTAKTEILSGGAVIDDYLTTFGYRTIRFDADHGFFLNETPLKLKGTCNHQDHAGVGAAVPDSIHEFRIRRLKEMGSNAYRCAHNPPASELLDSCDRLGMLVMDENRNFGSSPEILDQLRTMILRDRNHPSIILWSLFNEEPLQGTVVGEKMARTMARLVKELDPSRPITAAMNSGILDDAGVANVVDVMGINYSQPSYDPFHQKRPAKPIVSSENDCAFSTRGVYETSERTKYFDSYDRHHAPWGECARKSWKEIASRSFVSGIFIWTGFDYRGEPSPYEWPCISSHWGIMDTCGFAKDSFYLHKALWTEEPVIHILPHWNWPGLEGKGIKVMCFTNCEIVELFLNGRSLGPRPVDPYEQIEWEVPYEPGRLKAVGLKAGKAVSKTIETTGPAIELRLLPDRESVRADGEDALPVTVSTVDEQGRFVPTANCRVAFAIAGPGRIIGVGNGDPTCHEPDKGLSRSVFNGLCQVIVQADAEAGQIVLSASSPGLRPATLHIQCQDCARRPFVP